MRIYENEYCERKRKANYEEFAKIFSLNLNQEFVCFPVGEYSNQKTFTITKSGVYENKNGTWIKTCNFESAVLS